MPRPGRAGGARSDRQERQASRRAFPGPRRRADHPTSRVAQVADECRRHQRTAPRLLLGPIDDLHDGPSRALLVPGRHPRPSRTACQRQPGWAPATPAGTRRRPSTPAPRRRSPRASHVGTRSSWSASSCSSSTTIAATSGIGAHARRPARRRRRRPHPPPRYPAPWGPRPRSGRSGGGERPAGGHRRRTG